MTRIGSLAAGAAVGIVLLWVSPLVGLIAVLLLFAVVPPWGRTYAERAVISLVVTLGFVALAFPRAGATPIDRVSVQLFLTIVLVVVCALNFLPKLRSRSLPHLRLTDALLLALVVVFGFALSIPFLGDTNEQVVAGLYFAGWDNHAHYTAFANTYVSQSTTWPTADGSLAWNQWYPSLHTTLWALGTALAGGDGLDRLELLIPYVRWSAASFAASMVALVWMATDIADRWGTRTARRTGKTASTIALVVMAAWVVLGSPQYLFNAGFTNFAMGASLVAVASYLAVRSQRSARTLGLFVIPLAAISVVGLWTPLALGLVPAGTVVAICLLRYRVAWGVAWVVAGVLGGLVAFIRQVGDILSAGGEADATEFATNIGGVAVGMVPFNVAAALAAPLIAVAIALLVWMPWTLRWGLAGPSIMTGAIALIFVPGAVASGVWWLDSYYVQKALNAALLVTAPLLVAAAAVVLARALRQASAREAVAGTVVVTLAGIAVLGTTGVRDGSPLNGVPNFPGLDAVDQRSQGEESQWLGDLILSGVDASADLPAYAPVLWEGPGTLANLWTASLHGTLSSAQQVFYLSLPQPPSGDEAAAWTKEALNAFPELRIAFVPPSVESREFLLLRFGSADPRRVVVVSD
jgi:hypothetical protein